LIAVDANAPTPTPTVLGGNLIALEEVEMALSEVLGSHFNKVTEQTEETPADLPPEDEPPKKVKKSKPKKAKKSEPKKAKKSKRGRPTTVSKRTKKAMTALKENMRAFTGPMLGWDKTEDDMLIPNWKEQQLIDWMKDQLKDGTSASEIARVLRNCKIRGKMGGKWESSGVIKTTQPNRSLFHLKAREEFLPTAPKYFTTWTMKRPWHPSTDY